MGVKRGTVSHVSLEEAFEAESQVRPQEDRGISCKVCGNPVTGKKWILERGGSFEHTFRNPAGYSFHVVCFSQAWGCELRGNFSSEATWFPGFAWCFAICAVCGRHLGWYYSDEQTRQSGFYGLIATRLVGIQG